MRKCDAQGILLEQLLPKYDQLHAKVQTSMLSYIRSRWSNLKDNKDLVEVLRTLNFVKVSNDPDIPPLCPSVLFFPKQPFDQVLDEWPLVPKGTFAQPQWKSVLEDLMKPEAE